MSRHINKSLLYQKVYKPMQARAMHLLEQQEAKSIKTALNFLLDSAGKRY